MAVLLFDGINALDVTGPMEAFSTARDERGREAYSIETWGVGQTSVRSESGLRLEADRLLGEQHGSDILIVPGGKGIRRTETLEVVASWLQRNRSRHRKIASICTGAFALAESGLMDGRKLTTHWASADHLQERYPQVRIEPDNLYLQDGKYYSSGGIAAGIDLALELIDQDMGDRCAMDVARQMVVFLRRNGSQSQFSKPLEIQLQAAGGLEDICRWIANNLDADLSVKALADRAGLSTRQFSRRFVGAFGAPPATYVKRMRLEAASEALAQGVSSARVAYLIGFGSEDGFRRAFEGRFGVSPRDYRRHFYRKEACR